MTIQTTRSLQCAIHIAALSLATGVWLPLHAAEPDPDQDTQLNTVVVEAASIRQAPLKQRVNLGAFGADRLIDTPFSVSTISSADIEKRQASDLAKIFQYDASTSVSNSGRATQNGTQIRIRGLTPAPLDNYKIDGLAFPAWFLDLHLQHFERVELLKGVGGFAYGVGVPAGVINYVTKRPTAERILSLDAGYASDSIYTTHLDAGGPLDQAGRFGYRLNIVNEEGDNYNDGHVEKRSVSLALDGALTDDVRLTFDVQHLEYDLGGLSGTIALAAGSGFDTGRTISGRTKTGVDGLYKKSRMDLATVGLNWQLNPDWAIALAYRFADFTMINRNTFQQVINAAGDYNTFRSFSDRRFFFNQFQATTQGQFSTGDLQHNLTFGVQWQDVAQDDDRNVDSQTLIGVGNLFEPNDLSATRDYQSDTYRMGEYEQKAVFVNDTIDLSEHWGLMLGARLTHYNQRNYRAAGGIAMDYGGNHLTPSAALLYKPNGTTTFYLSWVDKSLQAGGNNISPAIANYGAAFAPMESEQVELGVKTQQDRWYAEAALFRIKKEAEYVNAQNYLVQDGLVRHQGLELSGGFQATSRVTLNGSLAWLDAEYLKAQSNFVGNRVEGTARLVATAFVDYQTGLPGLSLNAGVRHFGSAYSDAANTYRFDDYDLLEVGAEYKLKAAGVPVTLRASLRNLTDKEYWTNANSGWLQQGEPRNLTFNVKVDL